MSRDDIKVVRDMSMIGTASTNSVRFWRIDVTPLTRIVVCTMSDMDVANIDEAINDHGMGKFNVVKLERYSSFELAGGIYAKLTGSL